jgi:hypothetical protein
VRIRTQCRDCGLPFRAELDSDSDSLPCPNCQSVRPVDLSGLQHSPTPRVERCALCGCEHFYRQQDVNRAWGCTLVALGAALAPWTWGISLAVVVALDWWISRRLREAVVCYRCDTVYRDARPLPRQGEFDLLKHDVLKYGKTWEDAKRS